VTAHIHFGGGMLAKLGKVVGKVPREQANITLHNLKQLLETGEVLHSEASIDPGMHPGVPPEKYQPGSKVLSAAVGR
jgi:ribosomal protein L21E